MQAITQKEVDIQLRDSVLRQLEWEPQIASKDISVNAQEGLVTLTGFVHNYFERFAAERAAKAVYRVKAVANDIEVKPVDERTDPEIARDIMHSMKINSTVPHEHIKVSLHGGFATLEGKVDWCFQRDAAEACARSVAGIRRLINDIEVKPTVSPAEVHIKIEEALRRSAEVDSRRISVSAQGGTVTLSGNVRSWFEREEATRATWAAPGVSRVVDHICVVP